MYRTIRVKLDLDEESKKRALLTMEQYTEAFKIAAEWGFANKECNKLKVHHGTYYHVRELIPELPATLVESAKDTACEVLKRADMGRKPKRRPHSAIRFSSKGMNVHLGSGWMNFVAIGLSRIHSTYFLPACFYKYLDWTIKSGILIFSKTKNAFYFGIVVEKKSVSKPIANEVMGIDRGLRNTAVCSNNQFFNSKHVRNVKGKYAWLRARLQEKGTRSAKRRLKKLAGRERRFVTCENHKMTKAIAGTDYSTFVLEDLRGIHNKWTATKKMSKTLHSWSFWRFESFLEYKAEEVGKSVMWVNPNFTSQTCSRCGYIHPANRKGGELVCRKCGFELNADLNAARNIAQIGRTELSRLPVREPDATQSIGEVMRQGISDDCSCESSRIDNGHSEFRISGGSLSLGRPKCFQEYYYGREGLGEEE